MKETQKKDLLDLPVSTAKGVGKTRAAALEKLGVSSMGDLLRLYPRSYENRGNIKLLANCREGEKSAVILTVAAEPKIARIKSGMSLLKFRAYDESATAEITYFNQDFRKSEFSLGRTYRFYGKVEAARSNSKNMRFLMSSPAAEEIPYDEKPPLMPFVPIYPLSAGLTQKFVSSLVQSALHTTSALGTEADEEDADIIPREIRERLSLATGSYALREIHTPSCIDALAAAKKRLIFEELFCFSLGVLASGKKVRESGAPVCACGDIRELTSLLPYELTLAQNKIISEIRDDMAKDSPMSRLLVGDVGCGKTVCAAAALLIAVRSNHQAALMAPTEILASQHYSDLSPLFASLETKVELLTGSCTAAKKRKIYENLATGVTDIVIGTHALLSEGVEFKSLALVVTDEQHRFGVEQRSALAGKGQHVHTLVMSATPIPRSLALTLYGDLSLSVIDEMPKGRQRVDTFVVDESYRERLTAFIHKLTADGGQVYVVCPAVEEKEEFSDDEESEDGELSFAEIGGNDLFSLLEEDEEKEKDEVPPLKSAVKYSEELAALLPDRKVAFVHGKLKAAEKDRIMRSFAGGDIDILVSTTVIEVGVNVPNACLMIVENAERFGLSQLHQLRGRVGRGSRKSYCVLVSDSHSENARTRLDTMKTVYNGFEIAEKDLALRGPGDFLKNAAGGTRQSGVLRFRLADFCTDAELLRSAAEEAKKLIDADPTLENHPMLLSEIRKLFSHAVER